ncbi:carboxymuconolactone decarboxylase family protein [Candidatus Poriferisocius sp.]|uniref:carboxymuconolactone decarboxylase family protein n=1 Tax=Candidatus Poriferisocius sp. TaxID=3101276 RepID=UPI003B5CB5CC
MASLEPVDANSSDPALAPVFDNFRDAGRNVPLLYRLLGNAPAMLDAWVGMAWPLRSEPTTSRALRELQIMRVALLTEASMEWHSHWPAAIAAGASEAQLRDLGNPETSELFDPGAKAALKCTEEIITLGGASEEGMKELRRHFDDGECVELILTASFYACVSATIHSLAIHAPADSEPLAVFQELIEQC